MPYPTPPTISTSYTAEEQSIGDGTLPGQELDVDFESLAQAIEDTIAFLAGITRADGKLANGIVTEDALAASIRIGFNPPAPWAAATDYTTRSTVFQGFGFYLCTTLHTSAVFATDLASGRWQLLADLTPPGGGLIGANNLSDLPDKTAARANLLLGTAATVNSGTGSADFRTNAQNDARFQLLSAVLNILAGQTPAADQLPYYTGASTGALTPLTAFARTLLDDASQAAARTTLALTPGTDVQAFDADLTALAALAATGFIARTGAGAVAARTLVSADGTVVFTNPGGVAGNPDFSAKSGWEFVSQFYTGTSVATVDTPDFVAGYDYAVEMSWVRGVTNPATLQFAPFRVVAGTRPTAQSLKVSDSNYFSGWIEILAPMRTADQHHLSSQGTAYVDNNTVAYFGTITGNSALDWASTYGGTNDRVSSLRFSRGAGNISGGQMSLYRRPSRVT